MKRILLIEPNSKFAIKSALGISGPPLGLAYIASYLRENARCRIKILDALTLGCTPEDVRREIRAFGPDIVGINVMSTPAIYDAYSYAGIAKELDPKTFVMLGGQHVTFAHRETLEECPHIDAVVRGEGEATALDIVRRLSNGGKLKGCLGITYRQEGSIVENPPRPLICDLDTIPHPAYDLLPMDKYFMGKHRFAAIITSRGCPFGCTFCSSSRLVGRRYRARSAENVVGELELLVNKYQVSEIEFLDDLFTMDPGRVRRITELIRKRALKLTWTCSSRADLVTRFPRMVRWLKRAGCHTVYIGAEAGTQKSLDRIKKGITLEQVKNAVRILKRENLNVLASFVLGIPGETKKDMEKTIQFAKKLGSDFAQFTICTPFPGTPIYEEARKTGRLIARS